MTHARCRVRVLALADKGYRRALGQDPHLRRGLNVHEGAITYRAVADALKLPFTPPEASLGPAYRFNVYHLLRTPDPDALFPLEIEDLR